MSLLNQMLRDLDNKAPDIEPIAQESAVKVSINAAKTKLKLPLKILIIISILLLIGLLLFNKIKSNPTGVAIVTPLAIPVILTPESQSTILIKKIIPNKETELEKTKLEVEPGDDKTSLQEVASTKPMEATKNTKISIKKAKLTNTQQAEQYYQKALKTTDPYNAITFLRQTINLAPKHIDARLLLTRLFIKTNDKR